MVTTTSDILTEEAVRRVMEEERMEVLVWNQMFETIPMDSSIPNNTIQIPEDEGLMGEPERVAEGSQFPREEEDYKKTPITVEKHGFEVKISMESTLYSVFDQVARQTEKAARRMSEYLNRLAFNEVDGNLHPNTGSHTGNGSFDFQLLTDAKKELQDSLMNPNVLIVNTAGENALLNSDAFQRASELGDQIVREGAIGRVAGLDVVVDNSGLLGDSSTATGIMADDTEYGYEVVKEDVSTRTYEDESRQAEIHQLYTIRAYKAIDSEAAVKLSA
jgi:hypothetical protein